MSLRDKLGLDEPTTFDRRQELYEQYGVLENPFPPASQPMGHPHKETDEDDIIVARLKSFTRDETTQVIVIEGMQGIGKTNLLEYYRDELQSIYGNHEGYYIIRYYSDPEPEFGGVVRRIIQEFGVDYLQEIGKRLSKLSSSDQDKAFSRVRNFETRQAFRALRDAADDKDELQPASTLLLDYFLGLRVLKRHTEVLGIQFRLDTTESKTQALHDLIFLGQQLGCFKALFLFFDELEKQGGLPPQQTTRYLSAIRALVDALPNFLFLLLAMTPEARLRYSSMLPALASRLQSVIPLKPLQNEKEAVDFYHFYLDKARETAKSSKETKNWVRGDQVPLLDRTVGEWFRRLQQQEEKRGQEGVTQRVFLNRLYLLFEQRAS